MDICESCTEQRLLAVHLTKSESSTDSMCIMRKTLALIILGVVASIPAVAQTEYLSSDLRNRVDQLIDSIDSIPTLPTKPTLKAGRA